MSKQEHSHQASARVGIGIENATKQLTISGANGALLVENAASLANTGPFVSMAANSYSNDAGTFRFEDLRSSQSSPSFIWNAADNSGTVLAYDFQGGGASRIAITQSGNVAIGAASPNVTFHVSGNANVTGTLSTGSFEIQNAGAGTMNISGQTLLATDAGSVGIGNRNPNSTLHVTGEANITGYLEVGKGLNVSNGMNVLSGSVGIGTNSPQNRLEVVGATTLAGGVNASSLNVTGFSITDDSLVTLSDGSKKKIKDVKAGDYVLSLDENTGKLVPRKVNALLDHGIKPIYEMATEDGRSINTTAEHSYLVKLYSKEECKQYAGNVWNKEADAFNGFCTRWVEIRNLKEDNHIAVPKLKEYYSENFEKSIFQSSLKCPV